MLSIGALAQATGIPVATLRTWERRYGFPTAQRLPSGHRRFPVEVVEQLRDIRRALAAGHKPSSILPMGLDERREAMGLSQVSVLPGGVQRDAVTIERWLEAVRSFDAPGLTHLLRIDWEHRGARRFVYDLALPFLREVGDLWEVGELNIGHEHFASEQLRDLLSGRWRSMAQEASGPPLVLANLPGEQHCLGLHLAAVLLALRDARLSFLGANTPLSDIQSASRNVSAAALVIGASPAQSMQDVARALEVLREELPGGVELLVGGTTAPVEIPGVTWLPILEGLEGWYQDRVSPSDQGHVA